MVGATGDLTCDPSRVKGEGAQKLASTPRARLAILLSADIESLIKSSVRVFYNPTPAFMLFLRSQCAVRVHNAYSEQRQRREERAHSRHIRI